MHYQKKPVAIDAIQFIDDNYDDVAFFTEYRFRWSESDTSDAEVFPAEVYDVLHDTWVGVKVGDFIIRGIKGEYYPCDATVFFDSYEEC